VLKTANLPVPKFNIAEPKNIVLTRFPWFSTFDIAKLIVAQYPSLSFEGQRRLVQYAIAHLRAYDFDSDNLTDTSNSDFEPTRKSGTDYYSRQAVKEILEYMDFKVINDDRPYS
jgi:hypothetical protein